MIARRYVLLTVCACISLAPVRAHAADASAKSFVEAIYAGYVGKDSKGGPALDSNAAVRRYFAPKLAALIIKDRREAHGELPMLDSDPFIDAQDWGIDAVDVAVRDTGPGKASATVSFINLGERETVVLALVKLKAGWRIADITSRDGSLRGFLSK